MVRALARMVAPFLLILSAIAAYPAATALPAGSWRLVEAKGYEGVIVPAADAPDFFWMVNGQQYEEYWTPTAANIADLEAAIVPAFAALPPSLVSGEQLDTYRRQYGGFVEDGRRLIRISFFCDAIFPHVEQYWQCRTIFAAGGGACFFRLTYDPASGAFFDLSVNGPI
ncbi:MAG: hypothetical protein ACRDJH_05935 [Thermomicrobiales bacterium]